MVLRWDQHILYIIGVYEYVCYSPWLVSRAGTNNYIPLYLWGVLICSNPLYLLLAHASSLNLSIYGWSLNPTHTVGSTNNKANNFYETSIHIKSSNPADDRWYLYVSVSIIWIKNKKTLNFRKGCYQCLRLFRQYSRLENTFYLVQWRLSFAISMDIGHHWLLSYCRHPLKGEIHDDVIKWKHFPRYRHFVREIHRSAVNFPHKGQWRGALMFYFIYAWINGWVNNRKAGDLRRHRAHYDVIVMTLHINLCLP